jgi:hypothetical protein
MRFGYLWLVAVLALSGCAEDVDDVPPRVQINAPEEGLFTVNKVVEVDVTVTEEEAVDFVAIAVDGVEVDRILPEVCEMRCSMRFEWVTLDFDDGVHTLSASAVDMAGNVGQVSRNVELATGLGVDFIHITNHPDDGAFDAELEVEVHLRDADDDELVACTGGREGMAKVDFDDVAYDDVSSFFILPDESPLLPEDVQDRMLVAVVVEDDEIPCPAPENSDATSFFGDTADDLIARTMPFEGALLTEGEGLTFEDVDDVVEMHLGPGRFFTHHAE